MRSIGSAGLRWETQLPHNKHDSASKNPHSGSFHVVYNQQQTISCIFLVSDLCWLSLDWCITPCVAICPKVLDTNLIDKYLFPVLLLYQDSPHVMHGQGREHKNCLVHAGSLKKGIAQDGKGVTLSFGVKSSPAIPPSSDLLAAVVGTSSTSGSMEDMDCSSISEEDHNMLIETCTGTAPANLEPPYTYGAGIASQHKLPSQVVPRLNMIGLSKAVSARKGQQSTLPNTQLPHKDQVQACLPSSSTVPPQPLALPDWEHKRAPGAPPPSGATESAKVDCCLQPVADPTTRHSERTLSDPGECFSSRTTSQSMPTFRHYLGHALSDSGLGDSLSLSMAPVVTAAGRTPGATLTFRDLLPAQRTPHSVTPISRLADEAKALPHGERSCASTPDTPVPGEPVSGHSDADFRAGHCSIVAEEDCMEEEPGSPCMSCTPASIADGPANDQEYPSLRSPHRLAVHKLPPGSMLSNSGGVLETPESPGNGSPVSPPSMTPPAAVGSKLSAASELCQSWSPDGLEDHPPDKENASWLAQAESYLQARPKSQASGHTKPFGSAHAWPIQANHGKPLRCLSISNAGPLQADSKSPQSHSQKSPSCPKSSTSNPSAAETSAWRARHFRKLTDRSYFTDELIMEAMKASQQAPTLPVHQQRRFSLYAAPFEHSKRRMLTQAGGFRSASAPPGPACFDDSLHMARSLPYRPGSSLTTYIHSDSVGQLAPIAEPLQEENTVATSPKGPVSATHDRYASPHVHVDESLPRT
jgi:hypothetical protein